MPEKLRRYKIKTKKINLAKLITLSLFMIMSSLFLNYSLLEIYASSTLGDQSPGKILLISTPYGDTSRFIVGHHSEDYTFLLKESLLDKEDTYLEWAKRLAEGWGKTRVDEDILLKAKGGKVYLPSKNDMETGWFNSNSRRLARTNYWTRTIHPDYKNKNNVAFEVSSSGSIGFKFVGSPEINYGHGVRPAIYLPKWMSVVEKEIVPTSHPVSKPTDVSPGIGDFWALPPGELPDTVVDITLGNDSFSTFVAALTEADLVDKLQADGPFTVFVPTNAAFEKLLEALEIEASDLFAHPQLADVLLYHVVEGRVLSTDIEDGMEATTLQGEKLLSDLTDGIYINGSAVNTTDIEASNGVVHIIDTVLVPFDFELEAQEAPNTRDLGLTPYLLIGLFGISGLIYVGLKSHEIS